jgi:hypothetical protein
MSDLAPRPRGGWQVGTHFGKRDQREPIYSVDCPDVYGVEWLQDRSILRIRHFTHPDDETPCCIREVTRRAGESDGEMLARAYPPFALCAREGTK